MVARDATTVLMDRQVAFDPLVLSLSRHELDVADHLLAREVGELTEVLGAVAPPGQASDQERLIGSGIKAVLRGQGVEIDAVMHGLFETNLPLLPGTKTVGDIWTILPYENQIVTIDLSYGDLLALANELANPREKRDARALMGMRVVATRDAGGSKVTAFTAGDGSPLSVKPAYRIAVNSYDSQSGGGRFSLLGQLVANRANRRVLYPTQVRDALIDFFVARKKISKASLLV